MAFIISAITGTPPSIAAKAAALADGLSQGMVFTMARYVSSLSPFSVGPRPARTSYMTSLHPPPARVLEKLPPRAWPNLVRTIAG